MDIDVNKILNEYDIIISGLQRKVILLKLENEELLKLLEDKRKVDDNA